MLNTRAFVFLLLLAFLTCPADAQIFKKKKKDKEETEETDEKKKKGFLFFGKKNKDNDKEEVAVDTTDKKGLGKTLDKIFGSKEDQDIIEKDPEAKKTADNLRQYQAGYEEYVRKGQYEKALEYLQKFKSAQDSLLTIKDQRQKAMAEATKQKLEAEKQKAVADRQRVVTYGMMIGLALALGLAVSITVMFINKRKSNKQLTYQNETLEEANSEIKKQQEILDVQHQEILQSITYARRIQMAILPAIQHIHASFEDAFVLYRPKDIVSGDFFWFHHTENTTYLAAVDCTGHGVPGAFMSVLGMSLLNQIVIEDATLEAGEILNRLHAGVISSLKQNEAGTGQQDGMDISLIVLDKKTKNISYAGANNPIYVMHLGELQVVDADKSPIGGARYADYRFNTQEVQLEEGDSIYLFSDGLPDQFGGPRGRKFTYRRLRELIQANHTRPMSEIGKSMENTYLEWKGEVEQLDDVMVLGVRV